MSDLPREPPDFHPEDEESFPPGRQRVIHHLLKMNRSNDGLCGKIPLEDLYFTAYHTLSTTKSAVRFSLSAHAVIQLFDQMIICLPDAPIRVAEYEVTYLKERLSIIAGLYEQNINHRSNSDAIAITDATLSVAFFAGLKKELDLFQKPDRRTNRQTHSQFVQQMVSEANISIMDGGKSLAGLMDHLRKTFEKIKHQKSFPSGDKYKNLLDKLDTLLSGILKPQPFDRDRIGLSQPIEVLDRLDELTLQGESDD